MTCQRIKNGFACTMGTRTVYRYRGWSFEFHSLNGPHTLTKDGELTNYIPAKFWPIWEAFDNEPDKTLFEEI